MFYIVQYNGYCIIKLFEISKYIKDVKDLKYGMVALQHRGVVFMTVLLRNKRTYLVGLVHLREHQLQKYPYYGEAVWH